MPYLPIDPKHVGRTYEAVVRVNSQSGKGGVAYVMKAEHGLDLPRRLQIEFSKTIQTITEDTGTDIPSPEIWAAFEGEYLDPDAAVQLLSHETTTGEKGSTVTAQLLVDGEHRTLHGAGTGPLAAFVAALQADLGVDLEVVDYSEHAVSAGTDATAAAYVETQTPDGEIRWGVGLDESILTASLQGGGERRQPPPRPPAPRRAPRALTPGAAPSPDATVGSPDARADASSPSSSLALLTASRGLARRAMLGATATASRRGAGVRRRVRRGARGRARTASAPRPTMRSAWATP